MLLAVLSGSPDVVLNSMKLYVYKSSHTIWLCFCVCFSILLTLLGKGGTGLCAFCACVRFAHACLSLFSSSSLVSRAWLQFMVVAYPEQFVLHLSN